MIQRLAVLLFFLLPGAGLAQDVLVRSGEHEDFSRLVLEFPNRVEWQFGRVPGGYEIRVSEGDLAFDLSTVFDRIPKARIQAVRDLGGGRLFIASDCACYGDAFDLRTAAVVLDVKDGATTAEAQPFERQLPPVTTANEPLADRSGTGATAGQASALGLNIVPPSRGLFGLEDRLPQPSQARGGLPLAFEFQPATLTGADTSISEQETGRRVASPGLDSYNPQPDIRPQIGSDRVSQTETVLLEQIGRAAAQGLLDADLSETEARVEEATHPLPEAIESDIPAAQTTEVKLPSVGHLSVQTSIDRAAGVGREEKPTTQSGRECLPDKYFDVAGWGEDPESGANLSLYKASLLGEFDHANGESVLALARHYVYLTFGAEAAALAQRYEADIERPDILIGLAQIMDHGRSQHPDAMFDQMGCDGAVSLWATLAQPNLHRGDDIDTLAVVRAFSDLPIHLRRHLGPGLAARFLEISDTTTAAALRDAIGRAPGDHGASFQMLEAQLEIDQGQVTDGTARLADIVAHDEAISPDALLTLIEAKLAEDEQVAESTREIAASLAFEHRGTPLGESLLASEIRAHAQAADFRSAFAVLAQGAADESLGAQVQTSLRNDLFSQLTSDATDASFLSHVLPATQVLRSMPPPLRRQIVKRLIDLGFPEAARTILEGSTDLPTRDDRILFAEFSLLEGKPEISLGYLAGLADETALRLQAQALGQLGAHASAAELWSTLKEEELQAHATWKAQDWPQIAEMEFSQVQEVGLFLAQEGAGAPPNVEAGNAMVKSASALDQSRASRDALAALLGAMESP